MVRRHGVESDFSHVRFAIETYRDEAGDFPAGFCHVKLPGRIDRHQRGEERTLRLVLTPLRKLVNLIAEHRAERCEHGREGRAANGLEPVRVVRVKGSGEEA